MKCLECDLNYPAHKLMGVCTPCLQCLHKAERDRDILLDGKLTYNEIRKTIYDWSIQEMPSTINVWNREIDSLAKVICKKLGIKGEVGGNGG